MAITDYMSAADRDLNIYVSLVVSESTCGEKYLIVVEGSDHCRETKMKF